MMTLLAVSKTYMYATAVSFAEEAISVTVGFIAIHRVK